MTNLEPCPFCGGEIERYNYMPGYVGGHGFQCKECDAQFLTGSDDDEATELFNTRYKRTCEWNIKHSGTLYDVYQCSACGYEYAESRTDHGIKVELCDAKFCPNCGAEVVDA